ncbi:hypothetical protein EAF00_000742 [Botryotinia globosa]|nr:hypothetical protein EAF00_000742 [Botryotinia globosa]
MLFLQPVNLPNPDFRDIVSNLVIRRRDPVSSCSTPQYHPHLQLTPLALFVSSCAFSSFARCVSIEDDSPQTARTGDGYQSINQ